MIFDFSAAECTTDAIDTIATKQITISRIVDDMLQIC